MAKDQQRDDLLRGLREIDHALHDNLAKLRAAIG